MPSATQRFHMRIVNGGTPERIDTADALREMSNAQMEPGKRAVREMSAKGPRAARIVYNDARGEVMLRPATAEETAAEIKPEASRHAPGDTVTVRPVVYCPITRKHRVLPEYDGTVVNWASGHYNVSSLDADQHGHGVRPCLVHELGPAEKRMTGTAPTAPRPEQYQLIREAIPAEKPPAAAAPLFAALAAYQATGDAALTPSPRELHTLACHLEVLPLAAAPGLHLELRAARDDVEEAWESLHIADHLTSRNAAHAAARAAVSRARAVILAIDPHAARIHITLLPSTADDVRAAARAYHAVTGTPGELSAIETGSSQVRVHCGSRTRSSRNITATLTAGISTPFGHIPAHPPIVETFTRRSGCTDVTANARTALHPLLRVDVPVDYVLDHRV